MGKHRKRKGCSAIPLAVASMTLTGAWVSLVTAHAVTEKPEFNSGPMKLIIDTPVAVRVSRAEYRKPLPPPIPKGQLVVQVAMAKKGKPYVWGAKGPNQFDCSGLTQWSYKQIGINLGPDTYAQVRQGISIPSSQVRAGDLIFPSTHHVQLAISNSQVIEAPGRGMSVRIVSLPKSFVARRIV